MKHEFMISWESVPQRFLSILFWFAVVMCMFLLMTSPAQAEIRMPWQPKILTSAQLKIAEEKGWDRKELRKRIKQERKIPCSARKLTPLSVCPGITRPPPKQPGTVQVIDCRWVSMKEKRKYKICGRM